PPPGPSLARQADAPTRRRRDRTPARGDAGDAPRVDRTPARGGRRRLPGKGDRLPRRDGRPRALPQAVSRLRLTRAAHRLWRERDQLLRALPDGRRAAGGPLALAAPQGRLAAEPRGDGDGARGQGVDRYR